MRVTVTVSGGQGSTDFDAGGWAQDCYVQPPDATPMFDLTITNRRGAIILSGRNLDVPKPKVEGRYKTSVSGNTVLIFNAADDGVYYVEVPLE